MKIDVQRDFIGLVAGHDIKIGNSSCGCWQTLLDADRDQLEAMKKDAALARRNAWHRFITHPSVIPHLIAAGSFALLLISAPWSKPWLGLISPTAVFSLAIAHVSLCCLAAWYMQHARRHLQLALKKTKAHLAEIDAALALKE